MEAVDRGGWHLNRGTAAWIAAFSDLCALKAKNGGFGVTLKDFYQALTKTASVPARPITQGSQTNLTREAERRWALFPDSVPPPEGAHDLPTHTCTKRVRTPMSRSICGVVQMSWGQAEKSRLLFHLLQEAVNTSRPPPEEFQLGPGVLRSSRGALPGSYSCSLSHQRFQIPSHGHANVPPHVLNGHLRPVGHRPPFLVFFLLSACDIFVSYALQRQHDVIGRWCHLTRCRWEGISKRRKRPNFENVSTKRLFQDRLTPHARSQQCHEMRFNGVLK